MARPPQRVAVVDALRALALLPVVVINWVGYPALPDAGPLSPPSPPDSAAALSLSWLLHALIAGKGISLLAFLFGYSQSLSQGRTPQDLARRRQRIRKLLMLGMAHGCLLYMGDILTVYAVCGALLALWAGLSMGQLKVRLGVLIALDLAVVALTVVMSRMVLINEPSIPLTEPATWAGWTLRNAGHFLTSTVFFVMLGLPLPLLLMTLGLTAGRLRWLSHPRWRPAMARWARRWWAPALVANVLFASLLWPGLRDGDPRLTSLFAIFYLYPTLWLLSVAVPAATLALHRHPAWLARLAPMGRHTLTLYLGSSAVSLLLFSGAGISWQPGTVITTALAVTYWLLGLILASLLGPRRLPLETWLSR